MRGVYSSLFWWVYFFSVGGRDSISHLYPPTSGTSAAAAKRFPHLYIFFLQEEEEKNIIKKRQMWRCSITQRRQTTSASRLFIFFFYISFQILYFFLFSSTCWYREKSARVQSVDGFLLVGMNFLIRWLDFQSIFTNKITRLFSAFCDGGTFYIMTFPNMGHSFCDPTTYIDEYIIHIARHLNSSSQLRALRGE